MHAFEACTQTIFIFSFSSFFLSFFYFLLLFIMLASHIRSDVLFYVRHSTTSHIIWTRETWYLQCAMHVKIHWICLCTTDWWPIIYDYYTQNKYCGARKRKMYTQYNTTQHSTAHTIGVGWLAGWRTGWLFEEGVHQRYKDGCADGSSVMPQTANCCVISSSFSFIEDLFFGRRLVRIVFIVFSDCRQNSFFSV